MVGRIAPEAFEATFGQFVGAWGEPSAVVTGAVVARECGQMEVGGNGDLHDAQILLHQGGDLFESQHHATLRGRAVCDLEGIGALRERDREEVAGLDLGGGEPSRRHDRCAVLVGHMRVLPWGGLVTLTYRRSRGGLVFLRSPGVTFVVLLDFVCSPLYIISMSKRQNAPEFVFVYGTLRAGQSNHDLVEVWAPATLRNAHAAGLSLFLPSHRHFPYATPDSNSAGIQGDLLRIPAQDWPQARRNLDMLEGFNGTIHHPSNHYDRVRWEVTVGQRRVSAWVYIAGLRIRQQELSTMLQIPSGVWPPTPARDGAVLIAPSTHTSVLSLGDESHRIHEALGGPAEAISLGNGMQLWVRSDQATAADCQPNALASLLAEGPHAVMLLNGPALLCGQDQEGAPSELDVERVADALERCLTLAANLPLMALLQQAGQVQRSWYSTPT